MGMPFPALSPLLAAAIGMPIGLTGLAVQETIIRRRAARRAAAGADDAGVEIAMAIRALNAEIKQVGG